MFCADDAVLAVVLLAEMAGTGPTSSCSPYVLVRKAMLAAGHVRRPVHVDPHGKVQELPDHFKDRLLNAAGMHKRSTEPNAQADTGVVQGNMHRLSRACLADCQLNIPGYSATWFVEISLPA